MKNTETSQNVLIVNTMLVCPATLLFANSTSSMHNEGGCNNGKQWVYGPE